MKEKMICGIFYTLMRDFSVDYINEGVAEIKFYKSWRYLRMARAIRRWAKERTYFALENRADRIIRGIKEKIKNKDGK